MKYTYIHEITFQKSNKNNSTERFLKMSSWKQYTKCLFQEGLNNPLINLPKNFTLRQRSNDNIFGEFKDKNNTLFIFMADKIDHDEVPYGAYIIEPLFKDDK